MSFFNWLATFLVGLFSRREYGGTPVAPPLVPDAALTLMESFEGFVANPYKDPAGVWTIGFGSTRDANGNPVGPNTAPVSREQAAQLARRDMTEAAQEVARDVQVPLTDAQRAALDDFTYNLGTTAFRTSTLLRLINARDFAGAAGEFDKWDHAGGKELAGLLRRREAERKMFVGQA